MTVKNSNGKDSVLTIQFKKFQCEYEENDEIQLVGNVRSYSEKVSEDKNKVSIYVYTYFDLPTDEDQNLLLNKFFISGRICKIEPMRFLENNKNNIHFILANNIFTENSKLNSYLPCIAWGKCAKKLSECNKNDNIYITGELRSREYKKPIGDGKFEIRVAHELLVTDFYKAEQSSETGI